MNTPSIRGYYGLGLLSAWLSLAALVAGCGVGIGETSPPMSLPPTTSLITPKTWPRLTTTTYGDQAHVDGGSSTVSIYEASDSAVTVAGTMPEPGLRTHLELVAQVHLEFDYRTDRHESLTKIQPLVTEELFADLAAPLPANLTESLLAEQTVIEAHVEHFTVVEANVYAITYSVTHFSGGAHSADSNELTPLGTESVSQVTVIVSTDSDGIVADLR